MAPPLVVICHLAGRLFHEVEAALAAQYPAYAVHTDQPYPLCTYADFMRVAWRGPGDLVIVEGDSVPPAGSIARLLECGRPWCSHPSWVGDRYLSDTLGLVKFSAGLREVLPHLAEWALTGQRWRWGPRNRGLENFQPRPHLGEVPIDDSVLRVWPELAGIAHEMALEPGTDAHPKAIDMRLGYELAKARVGLHVHQPPAPHLRYPNDPARVATPPVAPPPAAAARGGA